MYLSIFCLFLLVLLGQGIGSDEKCSFNSCGGRDVHFPFRINTADKSCGYPGFDLSCQGEHVVLELKNSVRLFVGKIDYVKQVIDVSDPDACLPKQASKFDFSGSPFRFQQDADDYSYRPGDYTFFSCPAGKRELNIPVNCMKTPDGQEVYVVDSGSSISDLPLTSCTKLYNVSSVPRSMFETTSISLNWSTPDCGRCEEQEKSCEWEDMTKLKTTCKDRKRPEKGDNIRMNCKITGVVIGSCLVGLLLGVVYRIYRAGRKEKENQARIDKFLDDYKALKPTRYTYNDLKRITNQFQDKLGQGAFGTVFKGKLSSEIFVAVKILNSTIGNGEEFINEVGTMGRIHHVNVVRLVGFCADGFRRALVYEFLPNESLEKFIFSVDEGKNTSSSLGWEKLHDIALGIARGIEYLHQGCDQRILHFDIKPHNILLDNDFTPKIADFGLAKLCSKDQSAVSMTAARGTMGYIAPEVFSRNFGNVSYKSDVYSFGMLLLEMVGGRKNIDVEVENTSQVYFPEWIYKHLDQGEEVRIRIEEDGDAKLSRKLTIVGLWCIQWYPVDRPSMKLVVQMLEGNGENLTMPPNPFASGAKGNAVPGRRLHQELEVIDEVE